MRVTTSQGSVPFLYSEVLNAGPTGTASPKIRAFLDPGNSLKVYFEVAKKAF